MAGLNNQMGYEFSIVRLRKNADQLLSFPAELVSLPHNPLAGPFGLETRQLLLSVIARFPGAAPTLGIKNCFEIETPGGGRLEVWMPSDGHLFIESQVGLELLLALFVELNGAVPDLAIEDRQLGILHGPDSFAAWILGSEPACVAA